MLSHLMQLLTFSASHSIQETILHISLGIWSSFPCIQFDTSCSLCQFILLQTLSWFIILVLLTWSLATGWFPIFYPGWTATTYWVISLVSALLLFVSVLLHELAHSLVARARGLS